MRHKNVHYRLESDKLDNSVLQIKIYVHTEDIIAARGSDSVISHIVVYAPTIHKKIQNEK